MGTSEGSSPNNTQMGNEALSPAISEEKTERDGSNKKGFMSMVVSHPEWVGIAVQCFLVGVLIWQCSKLSEQVKEARQSGENIASLATSTRLMASSVQETATAIKDTVRAMSEIKTTLLRTNDHRNLKLQNNQGDPIFITCAYIKCSEQDEDRTVGIKCKWVEVAHGGVVILEPDYRSEAWEPRKEGKDWEAILYVEIQHRNDRSVQSWRVQFSSVSTPSGPILVITKEPDRLRGEQSR